MKDTINSQEKQIVPAGFWKSYPALNVWTLELWKIEQAKAPRARPELPQPELVRTKQMEMWK